ncbi:MAG: carbamate kinase [Coriobacteriia bacterium]|nr:carbamate kinase [Coriobacteriia bacterium]MBN2841198.1 carbamate kinase [Coriobacteriia bacterium]
MGKKRIVVALGGNALLRRSDPMTVEVQRANIKIAVEALAPLIDEYDLVLAHGNGPQVGLLALQAASYPGIEPYPLDVLGAQSQGMIAYMLEQELGNVLPPEKPIATLLTMVEIDPDDPAFDDPTKFVGPTYIKKKADALAAKKGWVFKRDGGLWRRVVASPEPQRIFEIKPIRWLIEQGTVVICTGGGGIPTAFSKDEPNRLTGVEAVIDKDLASELLARELGAELFVMATDTDGVYLDWMTPEQRRLGWVTPDELERHPFPAGSMGPKVEAAKRFVRATCNRAAIGRLEDIERIVAGEAGTNVVCEVPAGKRG